MTARLSPAQQRVVDAMRDGAELRRVHPWTHPGPPWWELATPGAFGGDRQRTSTIEALRRAGVIVLDATARRGGIYVLAAAYRGGEA